MNLNPIFVATTLFGLALWLVGSLNNRRKERKVFWCGFVIAVPSAFFIPTPPNWKSGIVLSIFVAGVMLVNAYFLGSNIKIRGKIYAYHVSDSLPDRSADSEPAIGKDGLAYDPAPDSYGGLATAKKSWWLHIIVVAICVFCIVDRNDDRPWLMPLAVACLVVMAVGLGYLADGSWGYPIARGQYLQFAIIAVITAGIFTVLYLLAFWSGKKWPLRRKQSMEYRVHPRHWRTDT